MSRDKLLSDASEFIGALGAKHLIRRQKRHPAQEILLLEIATAKRTVIAPLDLWTVRRLFNFVSG